MLYPFCFSTHVKNVLKASQAFDFCSNMIMYNMIYSMCNIKSSLRLLVRTMFDTLKKRNISQKSTIGKILITNKNYILQQN